MNARTMSLRGRSKGRQAANSSAMDVAARWGFAARGVIYLLIGLLALQIAFGGGGEQADRGGALSEIGEKPMGSFVLWALGIGLVGMCLWRLSEALFGASGPDGHKTSTRLLSAGRFLFYAFVAYSVLTFAMRRQGQLVGRPAVAGRHGQGAGTARGPVAGRRGRYRHSGRRAVDRGAGREAVVPQAPQARADVPGAKRYIDVTGVGGGLARGLLFAALGWFVIKAAVDYEPDKAKGFDATLRSFTDTPAGPWLLVLVAVGLVLFGMFSFGMARYRKV